MPKSSMALRSRRGSVLASVRRQIDIQQGDAFGDLQREALRRDAEVCRILSQLAGEVGHE